VIEESHRELLPNLSESAAVIRIFGVTKEGLSSFCYLHATKFGFLDNWRQTLLICLFIVSWEFVGNKENLNDPRFRNTNLLYEFVNFEQYMHRWLTTQFDFGSIAEN